MKILYKFNISSLYDANKEQAKDAGIILALACLVVGYYTDNTSIHTAAAIILVFNLIACNIFKPFAKVLLSLSYLLSKLTSPIILFLTYIILILPVGIFRQLMNLDSLSLNQWKKDDLSVLKVREHSYEPKDLNDPY
jgi:hypothetical protein